MPLQTKIMKYIYSTLLLFALSIHSQAQFIKSVNVTAGEVFSGETITNGAPAYIGYKNRVLIGFIATVEPTFFSFGTKKQFDFTTGFSFAQKGAYNSSPIYSYNEFGQILGTGEEAYPVRINYISVSPTVKFNFAQLFFVKAGPRMDVFTNFNESSLFGVDIRTNKDFNAATLGITYGAGICAGKKRAKFICEVIGQNDFTQSSYNKATSQAYKNYAVLLNFGADITLGKM